MQNHQLQTKSHFELQNKPYDGLVFPFKEIEILNLDVGSVFVSIIEVCYCCFLCQCAGLGNYIFPYSLGLVMEVSTMQDITKPLDHMPLHRVKSKEEVEYETTVSTLDRLLSIELPESAYSVLHNLAGRWTDIIDPKDLTLKRLSGAMTNFVYECHWERDNGHRPRKVIVRVYGEGSKFFFDRNDEILTFERMSQRHQGPHLLGRFPNGRVEEFLRARVGSDCSISFCFLLFTGQLVFRALTV